MFDVVRDILAVVSETTERVTSSTPALHNAIHSLFILEDFSEIFPTYRFEKRIGDYYFSRELHADLVNMESCGYINIVGFKMEEYILDKQSLLRSFHSDIKDGVVEEEKIRKASKIFIAELGGSNHG